MSNIILIPSVLSLGFNIMNLTTAKKTLNILKNDEELAKEAYKNSQSKKSFNTWRNDEINNLIKYIKYYKKNSLGSTFTTAIGVGTKIIGKKMMNFK